MKDIVRYKSVGERIMYGIDTTGWYLPTIYYTCGWLVFSFLCFDFQIYLGYIERRG